MDEEVWRLNLWHAGRASGGGSVGRDDPAGIDGLRARAGLESADAGAVWDAAGSFGAIAERREQRRVQRREGRTRAEAAGAASRRSGPRDCSGIGGGKVGRDVFHASLSFFRSCPITERQFVFSSKD